MISIVFTSLKYAFTYCILAVANMPSSAIGDSVVPEAISTLLEKGSTSVMESVDQIASFNVIGGSDLFGFSMQVSDSTVYIGDPGRNVVFVVSQVDGAWATSEVISAPDGIGGFGYDLALDRDTLIIGAYARIEAEEGAVYAFDAEGGLREVALSDDSHVVGFEVAASAGRVAYSRRQRNDPERQTGDVVLLSDGKTRIFGSTAYPDYFGASIDLSADRFLSSAPAYGPHGGAFLYDLHDGSEVRLAVPDHVGRVSVEAPLVLADDACLLSGAGNDARTRSIIWQGCDPSRATIISATGNLSASGGRVAFSGNAAFPSLGVQGPFSIQVFNVDNADDVYSLIVSERIERSLRRNVVLRNRWLAVALVSVEGEAIVELYELK